MQNEAEITNNDPQQMLFPGTELIPETCPYPANSERQRIEDKFGSIIHEDFNFSSLVSYVGNKKLPFLRIYRYKEAFAFSFVKDFLTRFRLGPDDYVF
jgi:hypothetical protein